MIAFVQGALILEYCTNPLLLAPGTSPYTCPPAYLHRGVSGGCRRPASPVYYRLSLGLAARGTRC